MSSPQGTRSYAVTQWVILLTHVVTLASALMSLVDKLK